MHIPTLALTLTLSLLTTLTSARINGFALPATIAPNSVVNITITVEDYIQTVEDVSMAFGFAPSSRAQKGTLGTTLLPSKTLGPALSNIATNISHLVTIPSNTPEGPIIFTGALFSLYGALYGPTVTEFTAEVEVGAEVSGDLVSSEEDVGNSGAPGGCKV